MPHPIGGVAPSRRLQEPQHIDVVNHVMVDHRPLPPNVSNSRLSSIGPSFSRQRPMTLALQDPATPFTIFPDVRPQVIRTQGQPTDPVSINSCFLHRHSAGRLVAGESRVWPFWLHSSACRTLASPCSGSLSSTVCSPGPYSSPTRNRKYSAIR